MMVLLEIVRLRLKNFLGNWRIMIAVSVLPLFFIYLIGSAFGEENVQARNLNVFVDEDHTAYSRQLLDLIKDDPMVVVIQADRERAFQLLGGMRAQNVFVILPGFGADVAAGKVPVVEKYATKGLHAGTTQYQLMAAIFRLTAVERTGRLVAEDYEKAELIEPEKAAALKQQVAGEIDTYWNRGVPFAIDTEVYIYEGKSQKQLRVIGFLGMPTGMILCFMALLLGFGVVFIIHDQESGLLMRVSMLAGEGMYYYGNLSGMLGIGVFSTLVVTAVSQIIFGIAPPCGYLAFIVIIACYGVLLVAGLTYLSILVGNAPAMYSVSAPLIIFLSYLGGCFFSIDVLPETLRYITFLSPQGLAIQGIKEAAKGEYITVFFVCAVMLCLAVPFALLTLHKLRSHRI